MEYSNYELTGGMPDERLTMSRLVEHLVKAAEFTVNISDYYNIRLQYGKAAVLDVVADNLYKTACEFGYVRGTGSKNVTPSFGVAYEGFRRHLTMGAECAYMIGHLRAENGAKEEGDHYREVGAALEKMSGLIMKAASRTLV